MHIEQFVNIKLSNHPVVKKFVKRCYQRSICAFSPSRAKAVGDITPVSPNDGYEYFFGYYDKSPWDATDRYMLCMKAADTWSDVSPREKAQIILIDTAQGNKITHLAETSSWNVQQGCMLQWLGPDYRSRVIFNDCRNGIYCAVILKIDIHGCNINVQEENVLPAPVYSVASDGSFALTLDFSRLYRLRPGYGYYNVPENTATEKIPDAPCIWYMSLKTGEIKPVLKYTDFAHFEPRKEMEDAEHKVNHIMISPNGKRFMVLHRWFQNSRKYTRLITCNVDGTEMFNLSDDDMTSHCCWKNDEEILAFANKRAGGCGYYLMKDKTHAYERYWSGIDYDGHPSYSPDGSKIVFDRYPDRTRMASIMVSLAENRADASVRTLARVFAPFKYDNDTRCDLHPRWNHAGDSICFDSVFEGHRGLYTVSVDCSSKASVESSSQENRVNREEQPNKVIKFSIITPVYNSFDLMEDYFRSLKSQTYKNFEVILIDDGSGDGSYEKLKRYIKDSNLDIKLYTTGVTSGPGYARNIGIDAAAGDWITFIDSDDKVESTLLSEICSVIENNNVNCVIYDLYVQTEKKVCVLQSMYHGNGGICTTADCIKYARNHSVGKFYKLSDINVHQIRFPELKRCEDVAFTCQAIVACGNIYYYNKPLYYYIQRNSSLSNNANMDETDMIKAFDIILKAFGDSYKDAVKNKSVTDLLYGGTLMMCKAGKSRKDIVAFIKNYNVMYPEWKESEILNYLGISKRIFIKAIQLQSVFALKILCVVHSYIVKR